MIHYHGTPITPEKAAAEILIGRHGLVSFAHPGQIRLVSEICHSFVIDNGAYSFWKKNKGPIDTKAYYSFVDDWKRHPGFDWALIPDIIDGSETDNDHLLLEWPFGVSGVPVWHIHESLDRLIVLTSEWPRIAIGSSGQYAKIGTASWWKRMNTAMDAICDKYGQPETKLHGLRMLDPRILCKFPFSSADSCNIARNIGIDKHWLRGSYPPPTKAARGIVMAHRIEHHTSASQWTTP